MNKKKGRAKSGSGPDPEHDAYLAGLKGIQSSLVDVDIIETEHRVYVLAAEDGGRLTAYALWQDSPDSKPNIVSKDFKFDGGVKITSASFSQVKSEQTLSIAEERSAPALFFVAASCFDHVEVKVLNMIFANGKFEFKPVQNTLKNCHIAPVGKIRLSKKFPRLLVTCGFEKDCYLKLWNVMAKQEEGKPA